MNDTNPQTKEDVTTEFIRLLRNLAPALYTIEMFNQKFLKDMKYGEIQITEIVKDGRIIRIEVVPKYSKMIP